MPETIKTPGQLFIDRLIQTGTISREEDLTPEQLQIVSQLNQSRDILRDISEDVDINQ